MKKARRILIILLLISAPNLVLAQMDPASTTDYNNIKMPESPTSASLGKVDDLTVNTATGVPNITIPLYTFELDGVSVPISISYNASGIKVTDLATSVGLNWSLEAGGQISRTVRGKADESRGWFSVDYSFLSNDWFNSYDPNNPQIWQRNMIGHQPSNFPSMAKLNDHNPDLFSYSFPGHSGNFIHKPNEVIIKEKTDGVEISNWTLAKDINGNEFHFQGGVERSNNKNIYGANGDLNIEFFDWEQTDGFIPITTWKLGLIRTKNEKEIRFEYEDSGNFSYTINTVENNITVGYPCEVNDPPIKSLAKTKIEYNFNTQLIKRIFSPDGNIEVTFTYATDPNLPEGVWATHLDEITIIDHTDVQNPKKRGFRFLYDRYGGDPRLRLDELYEVWYINEYQTVDKPHYKFYYESGSLPYKNSLGQDFFGYNNNATNNISLVPPITGLAQPFQGYFNQNSGNRSLNSNYLDIGVLKEIEYPTGGKLLLTYEPNSEDIPNNSIDKYMGGLRVQKIQKMDGTDIVSQQTFNYEDLHGISMELDRTYTMKQQGGISTNSYYSSFTSAPGNIRDEYRTGYFYGKVTITTTDPDPANNASYKEEHIYEQNLEAFHKFDYALKEKHYYKDGSSLPIKTEEYKNEIVGDPTYFNWNILGDMMCFELSGNGILGHNNNQIKVFYAGDYAFLPTQIATTDFLGSNRKPVTVLNKISYDPETLLKTQEITDNQTTRNYNPITEEVTYDLTDNKAEIITTDYQYPWSDNINLPNLPQALPISKIVKSNHYENGGVIFGQFFEYDTFGNIKRTYQYNKGEIGNIGAPAYIPNDYEEMSNFLFSNGKPVQVFQKSGEATTYIWGLNGQFPVAKIEGKTRAGLPQQKLAEVEGANYSNLSQKLTNLRNDASMANAMVTTYTYKPLAGVETITDPKGDKVTYHYDELGRLDYVVDKDGNRLTENEYNYRPQQ